MVILSVLALAYQSKLRHEVHCVCDSQCNDGEIPCPWNKGAAGVGCLKEV